MGKPRTVCIEHFRSQRRGACNRSSLSLLDFEFESLKYLRAIIRIIHRDHSELKLNMHFVLDGCRGACGCMEMQADRLDTDGVDFSNKRCKKDTVSGDGACLSAGSGRWWVRQAFAPPVSGWRGSPVSAST